VNHVEASANLLKEFPVGQLAGPEEALKFTLGDAFNGSRTRFVDGVDGSNRGVGEFERQNVGGKSGIRLNVAFNGRVMEMGAGFAKRGWLSSIRGGKTSTVTGGRSRGYATSSFSDSGSPGDGGMVVEPGIKVEGLGEWASALNCTVGTVIDMDAERGESKMTTNMISNERAAGGNAPMHSSGEEDDG
jgi:hypothetical protein